MKFCPLSKTFASFLFLSSFMSSAIAAAPPIPHILTSFSGVVELNKTAHTIKFLKDSDFFQVDGNEFKLLSDTDSARGSYYGQNAVRDPSGKIRLDIVTVYVGEQFQLLLKNQSQFEDFLKGVNLGNPDEISLASCQKSTAFLLWIQGIDSAPSKKSFANCFKIE